MVVTVLILIDINNLNPYFGFFSYYTIADESSIRPHIESKNKVYYRGSSKLRSWKVIYHIVSGLVLTIL